MLVINKAVFPVTYSDRHSVICRCRHSAPVMHTRDVRITARHYPMCARSVASNMAEI